MGRHSGRSTPSSSAPPGRNGATITPMSVVVLAGLAMSLIIFASPARAADGQSPSAATLVQEAIAIIRGQPELRSEIADMIRGAIAATDTTGVDIGLVSQAQTAFEAGDLSKTELLLEEAVGAAPGQPVVSPNTGPRLPVRSASPPPIPPHIRSIDRSRVRGVQGAVLLALASIVTVIGATVVWRFR